MIEELDILKNRITKNLPQLSQIHPYTPYFLNSLTQQLNLKPNKTILDIWLNGGNDLLISELTKTLEKIEEKKDTSS